MYLKGFEVFQNVPVTVHLSIVCPAKQDSKRKQNLVTALAIIGCQLVILEFHFFTASSL